MHIMHMVVLELMDITERKHSYNSSVACGFYKDGSEIKANPMEFYIGIDFFIDLKTMCYSNEFTFQMPIVGIETRIRNFMLKYQIPFSK